MSIAIAVKNPELRPLLKAPGIAKNLSVSFKDDASNYRQSPDFNCNVKNAKIAQKSDLHKVANFPSERAEMSTSTKLSQSRGITLPSIKLGEINRHGSASLLRSDIIHGSSTCPPAALRKHAEDPLDANSPIGYTLKHSDDLTLSQDASRAVLSESFTKVAAAATQSELPSEIGVIPTEEEEILDIRIFFPNGKAVQFSVEGGMAVRASELLDLMAEHLQIDSDVAGKAFALWLISPLLEVQLKPHHVAFEVHEKWSVFLRKFAIAEEEEIALDEPLLVIRRNFQLTIANERLYANEYERLAEVLYLDAKDQYLTGRYLVDVEKAVQLAALQLAVDFEPFESVEEAMDLIQDNLGVLVPAQHLSAIRTFRLFGVSMMECRSGMENELVDEFRRVSVGYANNHERRKAFIAVLQETPFYGAAFFTGLRERKSSVFSSLFNFSRRVPSTSNSTTVTVGINHEFITVVNPSRHELITCQPIANCNWKRFDESPKNTKNGEIPLFVLQYPDGSTLSSASDDKHRTAMLKRRNNVACAGLQRDSVSVEFHAAARDERTTAAAKKKTSGDDERNDDDGEVVGVAIVEKEEEEEVTRKKHSVVVEEDKPHLVNRQIFSKQAAMMEALLNSLCNEVYGKLNMVK